MNSPKLPALALSFVVVPIIPAVVDGVIEPVDVRDETVLEHVNPAPDTQWITPVEQLGIAKAVGDALDPVAFANTVLAAIAAMPFTPTPPQDGALDVPVDTIACPLDDAVGLINWTGKVVAEMAAAENRAKKEPKIFFMSFLKHWSLHKASSRCR
jgi:hypothetical protein